MAKCYINIPNLSKMLHFEKSGHTVCKMRSTATERLLEPFYGDKELCDWQEQPRVFCYGSKKKTAIQ